MVERPAVQVQVCTTNEVGIQQRFDALLPDARCVRMRAFEFRAW